MGDQTTLGVEIELYTNGYIECHNVRIMGMQIDSIIDTEDREDFQPSWVRLARPLPQSPRHDDRVYTEGRLRDRLPVLVQSAFALSGLGSGFSAS